MKNRLILAGTGHRPNKLGGYSDEVYYKLVDFAVLCLREIKPTEVISGMALGWDQALVEAAIIDQIPFEAAIPFFGQEKMWPDKSKRKYNELLDMATRKTIVCKGGYTPEKMQIRNVYMSNACDKLLALWDGTNGGTANCIRSTQAHKIINVWDKWIEFRN